jgi:hypothetical protein
LTIAERSRSTHSGQCVGYAQGGETCPGLQREEGDRSGDEDGDPVEHQVRDHTEPEAVVASPGGACGRDQERATTIKFKKTKESVKDPLRPGKD